jgi:hypothetical protein
VWALFLDEQSSGLGVKAFGIFTLAASAGLIVYGFYFRKKSKNIIV